MTLGARTHTEMVCARPGFCRAGQVVSQQSPYGLEVQSGTEMERLKEGDGGRMTAEGNHGRRRERRKRRGGKLKGLNKAGAEAARCSQWKKERPREEGRGWH